MRNTKIGYSDIKDPLGKRFRPFFTGRDKARTPMQWNSGMHGGFTIGQPWVPVNSDSISRNVEDYNGDQSSLLNFYRDLFRIRKANAALQQGRWVPLITGRSGILAYARILNDERIVVILNFTSMKKKISLPEHSFGNVLFSTHRNAEDIFYFQGLRIYPFEVSIYKA